MEVFRHEGKPAVTTSSNAPLEFGVSNPRERRTIHRSSRRDAMILEMYTHEEHCLWASEKSTIDDA